MLKATIDGANMLNRADAHAELARSLQLPEHYGANLDALYDCASTMDAQLTLVRPAPMLNALRVYGCKLIQTLWEASDGNPGFQFRIEEREA